MHPGRVQLQHPQPRIAHRCPLQLLPSNFTNPTNSSNPTGATLANYNFVLIPIPGTRNPADGPSRRPHYVQDIPVPTGSLIPPNALRLLPSNFTTNALFASIVGVHTVEAVEPTLQERIISSYPTDAIANQHIFDPQHPWSCNEDGLLLHKGLVYVPTTLHMDILREHHDAPLAGHPGTAQTIELIT